MEISQESKKINIFNDMVGKTILSVKQMKLKDYDDAGFLRIIFTDNTHCVIFGGYDEIYTGDSNNEYPTLIGIAREDRELMLEDLQ